jgi:hypothetical protein
MRARHAWLAGAAMLITVSGMGMAMVPVALHAQTPASLSDEDALSLVLPPLANGQRPGVHLWARADQSQGPGGLPTVFIVTLYTKQAASGPEEHEVVNYLQYAGGGWVPARPRDDGTLLVDDWAWISLNLTNLTAVVGGQGNTSRYTVDYTSAGNYAGAPRQIMLEEVYAADLSDTNASTIATPVSATVVPTARPTTAAPTSSPVSSPAVVATPPSFAPVSTPIRSVTPASSLTPGLPVR